MSTRIPRSSNGADGAVLKVFVSVYPFRLIAVESSYPHILHPWLCFDLAAWQLRSWRKPVAADMADAFVLAWSGTRVTAMSLM